MFVSVALVVLQIQGPLMAAKNKPAADLLGKLRHSYAAIKSAHVSIKTLHYGHETHIVSTSECDFQGPASFHISTRGIPGLTKDAYQLTTDGKQIHVEGLPGKPLTIPYSLQAMVMNSPQLNLEVLCLWDWKRQFSTNEGGNMAFSRFEIKHDSWNGKAWTVLEETARRQNVVADYYIDPNTYLIWRTVVYNISPHRVGQDVQVQKWDTNAKVDPTLFKIAK